MIFSPGHSLTLYGPLYKTFSNLSVYRNDPKYPPFNYYTCDKQVLWENAGAFYGRQLVSACKSQSSGVRGLVVRCLPFNPKGSCSNPCVCANFSQVFRSRRFSLFSGLWDFPFRLCDFSPKIFQCPQRVLPSICLIFCNTTNVEKSQRVPFSDFSALWDC